jgi:Metallo-peptidase family M12B Reprolysin-like
MFGVTQFSCATGYYSFGHEIGHNFGMQHDRGTENTCGETTFNYGYRNPNAEFRTILSYDCATNQCDNMPTAGCPRIQRFSNSNPAYTFDVNNVKKIIGDATRDNAKQFNNNRALVASFFPAMDCAGNSDCNDGDSKTMDTCETVSRVCVFTPVINAPPVPSPVVVTAPVVNTPVAVAQPTPTTPSIPATIPTKAPTRSPTKEPTRSPTRAPTRSPVGAPTQPPTRAPTRSPTRAPTRSPTKAPTRSPTKAPIAAPLTFFMESMKITGVTSATWTTVLLTKLYSSPIPVCSVKYDTGTSLLPAIVRVQNVGTSSFDIRLQNPSDKALTARDVHCVVVEEGAWKMPDGRFIEAKKYSSTVTDNALSWIGETRAYQNKYTSPVVLGQVMSFNDPKWSVFWSRSSSGKNIAPTATSLITGKHVGEDPKLTRIAETVGYIVMESGHSRSNPIEIETGRGPDSFIGYTGKKTTYKFRSSFAKTPVVAVLCQAAMDDSNGSWALLTSNPTTSAMGIAVDEDQTKDSERTHSTEEVNYAVFAASGAIQLSKV